MRLILTTLLAATIAATPLLAQERKEPRRIIVRDGEVIEGPGGALPLIRRTFIGVHLVELTPELRAHFNIAGDAGVMVSRVLPDSPADRASIRVGDIITAVDGKSVVRAGDIERNVRQKNDGETVQIDIVRNGVRQRLSATVAQREVRHVDIESLLGDARGAMALGEGQRIRVFSSPEWQERFSRIDDCANVQKRLEELESRLQEMERKGRRN